eukprot:comp29091_c0_seq1/m.47216 comp29091_c0_seq1/g.47216  ORF comp29091_c0_seq1/g.47216 comp29091_c0_seq1/m.47216 type:complete len:187 (-) comp29091_c0_seq1:139-699(-)
MPSFLASTVISSTTKSHATLLPLCIFSKRTMSSVTPRPPLPPFTEETAKLKVQAAEDAWNTRDPERVAGAYTVDSVWRNRDKFITGREQIKQFLKDKWTHEQEYRLKKHYFAHSGNKIAVTFQYEYKSASNGKYYRAYGNEHWTFDENGYMKERNASINDVEISKDERLITKGEGLGRFSTGTFRG